MIKLPLVGVVCDHCDAHQHGGGAVKKYEYLDVEKVFIHSFLHVNSVLQKNIFGLLLIFCRFCNMTAYLMFKFSKKICHNTKFENH